MTRTGAPEDHVLLLIVAACQGLTPWVRPTDRPPAPEPPAPIDEPSTPHPAPPPVDTAVVEPEPDPCDADAIDPGPPARPATVEIVTITARTGAGESDWTTDPTLQACLGAHCFPLSPGSGVQLGRGAVGVWMFEGLDLPRAELDRIELRTAYGEDGWTPVALDVRLDGEPVYCSVLSGVRIGNDHGEQLRWSDPAGLHQSCASVWDGPLTHGPTVMAVGPDRANLWVRTDATRQVEVRVRPSAGPADERIAGFVYPLAADDFTGVVQVECLEPRTTYTYEVWVDGVPQGEHTFTTAPADGAPTSLRLAFGSCASGATQPIFRALDAHDPDLFAFVGDNHYANTDDLDSLRYWYRRSLEVTDRAAFLRSTPSLATWDDHDFVGDDTDGSAPGKDRALRAFVEYQANPSAGLPGTPGVFFATRWGDVDLFVLDDRYWRGVDGDVLGAGQHAWLVERLTTSTATFKLLVSGTQWTLEGDADSWAQYPAERDALLDLIADEGITGVILLSGDIHRGEIREIGAGAYDVPEITSSPLAQQASFACDDDSDELLDCVPGVNQWATLAFDTARADPRVVVTFHGEDGGFLATRSWTLSQLTP